MSKDNQVNDVPRLLAVDESERKWVMDEECKDIAQDAENTQVTDREVQESPNSQICENQLVTDKPQVEVAEEASVEGDDDFDDIPDSGIKNHPMEALGEELEQSRA